MTMVTIMVLFIFSLNFLVVVFVFVPLDDDVSEDVIDFGERDTADAN